MAIYVVGGLKGGTGKSTTAVNLAAMLALAAGTKPRRKAAGKLPVLLVDADPVRGGAVKWGERRSQEGIEPAVPYELMLGTGIYNQLLARAELYENIIVDCGGHDSPEIRGALMAADLWLVPTRPNQNDIDFFPAIEELAQLMQAQNPNLQFAVMLTQVRDRTIGKKRAELADVLAGYPLVGAKILERGTTMRGTYELCQGNGLAVVEFASKREIARTEMDNLYKEIFA